MCELLAMSSRHPTKLTSSLTALASHAKGVSRDGWGAAFYQGHDVALYRDVTSAEDSLAVHFLESSGPTTTLSIAYIRHATHGTIALANTGPYMRELNGRMHVFAHNGSLTGLPKFDKERFRPVGETDSEQAFCFLLERMSGLDHSPDQLPSTNLRMNLVAEVAKELRTYGPASFLYSDGDLLFAHADRRIQPLTRQVSAPALYRLECPVNKTSALVVDSGDSDAGKAQKVVLFASVPLTNEAWKPMPEGELIAVQNGEVVSNFQL
jgi:glutamine amidotransferase